MTDRPIYIDKKRGLAPALTYCRRCGGDANEIAMLGTHHYKAKCSQGHGIVGVTRDAHRCPSDDGGTLSAHEDVAEGERVPAGGLCGACTKEVEEHRAIVAAGGVYFRCRECKKEGVVKGTAPLAALVRKRSGTPAPAPIGVEFKACAQHTVKEGGEPA